MISCGSYATNCYILTDTQSGERAAVDCAVFDGAYRDFLHRLGVASLKYILLTHGHFDHILGVKQLKELCGGEVCIHEADAACLTDEKESLNFYSHYGVQEPVSPDVLLRDGDTLALGESVIGVRSTPGHTRGSVCFTVGESMFCGDTLFRLSMGRTDMPGGSTRALFQSLEALGRIPGNLDLYPGHGELTTLLFEKENNRYLRATKKEQGV